MNIGGPIQDTRGEPEFAEAPEIPDWLFDELMVNQLFVQEAIENTDMASLARAFLADNSGAMMFDVTHAAVKAWIEHYWYSQEFDETCISRMWREALAEVATHEAREIRP